MMFEVVQVRLVELGMREGSVIVSGNQVACCFGHSFGYLTGLSKRN